MSVPVRAAVAARLADALSGLGPPAPGAAEVLRQLTVTPGPRASLTLATAALPAGAAQHLRAALPSSTGLVRGVEEGRRGQLLLELEPVQFRRDVLDGIARQPDAFWRGALTEVAAGEPALVEFSSPNIAKPFHVGHLRSTVVGNFVCNVLAAVGPAPVRLNYLGDWGAQFGLLSAGCETAGLDAETLGDDGISRLLEVYIDTCRRAETEPAVREASRRAFHRLEMGDATERRRWAACRRLSLDNLRAAYQRLAVTFDAFDGESMYPASKCESVMTRLHESGALAQRGGATVAVLEGGGEATLARADGSTVYLTRDLAAAEDRYRRFGRRRLLYVVDAGQAVHFANLRALLSQLGHDWAGGVQHVPFGLIRGMSTRRGEAVFMHDLLDEARERMLERQRASPNTAHLEDPEGTADVVGTSAVIIHDLRQRRQRSYDFSWEAALRPSGDGGVRLQYLHARLCSLERRCGVELNPEADAALLVEPEAAALVSELARYEEALVASHDQLEPCKIVTYLFGLANTLGRALTRLPVKGAPRAEAEARLLAFHAGRLTLAQGMKVLGLRPLERM
ncbi:probable arginine--tRNA ligase, mitochondrial [Amphibalanus amphitrite]|uniref:probable arginine--tRNA ligase, mitochondrial n=1 Tax=Amphibalanus amphitrite TaxID=1232801 RepID=UPI001C910DFF|nr:probable arginine--tRNA ligase, mitochondrial [Amphibalanus amphitrite]XP_043239259.1 probable arginine--tRNA ligase, mitochondrial [Amphibalanus amphitrite]